MLCVVCIFSVVFNFVFCLVFSTVNGTVWPNCADVPLWIYFSLSGIFFIFYTTWVYNLSYHKQCLPVDGINGLYIYFIWWRLLTANSVFSCKESFLICNYTALICCWQNPEFGRCNGCVVYPQTSLIGCGLCAFTTFILLQTFRDSTLVCDWFKSFSAALNCDHIRASAKASFQVHACLLLVMPLLSLWGPSGNVATTSGS